MLALDPATGRILWDTKLRQMADGDATVVNDLVLTTTFEGHLIALARDRGDRLGPEAPALTNAPVAGIGDTACRATQSRSHTLTGRSARTSINSSRASPCAW
jgi:outer membrane protein assembly factor BamB